jgi:hypothetical protein
MSVPQMGFIQMSSHLKELSQHTSLRRTEVLAGRGRTRTSAAGLFNAHSAAFDDLALEAFPGSLSLFRGNHFNESESTRFLGVRVSHDLAFLNLTILFKHLGDLSLRQTRMDTSDEEVGAGVNGTIVILLRAGCILDVAAIQVNSATARRE